MDSTTVKFEGSVEKTSGIFKKTAQIWMVLEGLTLTYYKDQKKTFCVGSVDVAEIQTARQTGKKQGREFEVSTKSTVYSFTVEADELAEAWVHVIQQSMLQKSSLSDVPDKKKMSSDYEEISNVIPARESAARSKIYEEINEIKSSTSRERNLFGVHLRQSFQRANALPTESQIIEQPEVYQPKSPLSSFKPSFKSKDSKPATPEPIYAKPDKSHKKHEIPTQQAAGKAEESKPAARAASKKFNKPPPSFTPPPPPTGLPKSNNASIITHAQPACDKTTPKDIATVKQVFIESDYAEIGSGDLKNLTKKQDTTDAKEKSNEEIVSKDNHSNVKQVFIDPDYAEISSGDLKNLTKKQDTTDANEKSNEEIVSKDKHPYVKQAFIDPDYAEISSGDLQNLTKKKDTTDAKEKSNEEIVSQDKNANVKQVFIDPDYAEISSGDLQNLMQKQDSTDAKKKGNDEIVSKDKNTNVKQVFIDPDYAEISSGDLHNVTKKQDTTDAKEKSNDEIVSKDVNTKGKEVFIESDYAEIGSSDLKNSSKEQETADPKGKSNDKIASKDNNTKGKEVFIDSDYAEIACGGVKNMSKEQETTEPKEESDDKLAPKGNVTNGKEVSIESAYAEIACGDLKNLSKTKDVIELKEESDDDHTYYLADSVSRDTNVNTQAVVSGGDNEIKPVEQDTGSDTPNEQASGADDDSKHATARSEGSCEEIDVSQVVRRKRGSHVTTSFAEDSPAISDTAEASAVVSRGFSSASERRLNFRSSGDVESVEEIADDNEVFSEEMENGGISDQQTYEDSAYGTALESVMDSIMTSVKDTDILTDSHENREAFKNLLQYFERNSHDDFDVKSHKVSCRNSVERLQSFLLD